MLAQRTRRLIAAPRAWLLRRLFTAIALHRQRQNLLKLDDPMLRDIGLTAGTARAEAARPFWDATEAWMQQRP